MCVVTKVATAFELASTIDKTGKAKSLISRTKRTATLRTTNDKIVTNICEIAKKEMIITVSSACI